MAYKQNWQSKECSIEEALSLLRMVAQEYTNYRFTVRIITDDGGKHLGVYAEHGPNGEEPYHAEIDTRFMGWRTVWFQLPHGYIDSIMETKDVSSE